MSAQQQKTATDPITDVATRRQPTQARRVDEPTTAPPAPAAPAAAAAPAPPANAAPTTSEAQPTAQGGPSQYGEAVAGLKQRWLETQAHILDDPREAVTRADGLMDDVLKHLNASLGVMRQSVHDQWAKDESLSTDELRTTMQRYRTLFRHILDASAGPQTKPQA